MSDTDTIEFASDRFSVFVNLSNMPIIFLPCYGDSKYVGVFLSVILCSTQLRAFDMNVTHDDMLRVGYGHLIGDLLSGDRAYVHPVNFCSKNDQLF